MKILAIRIQNLASLEGQTEIDFTSEPLCSAGIFAITGATGAGKSTILDALCLALYGKTPRYWQAKEQGIEVKDVQGSTLSQGDVRGILRDGTAEGFAEVDFKGIDGQYYRANWNVRRARNKAEGSMQSDSITLKNITTNIPIPGKKQETLNEIARLVGLNFEQFTRSVLLAQGDFTAFMKANRDEKSSLLEKLTGTHIYSEISKKIYANYKIEEVKLRELNLRKEGIATLGAEELKALLDDQETLEAQIKILEQEIEKLTAEINWHEQLVKLQTGHDEANNSVQLASEAKTLALPRKQKLLMAEQAQQTRSWADALTYAQQQHAEKTTLFATIQETIATLQQQKSSLETKLKLAEDHLSEKNKAVADALPLLEKAKRLDTLLSEKKEQTEKLKADAEKASDANNKHQEILTAKQNDNGDLSLQIKNITDWKAQNTDRSAIAENEDIILTKLQDAQRFLEIVQSATTELNRLEAKIQTDNVQKTALESNRNHLLQDLENKTKNYDVRFNALLLTPIEQLNLDKTETDRQTEDTIKAQYQWQLFYNAMLELDDLNKKLLHNQSDYKTKQETSQELTQQLPVQKAQKDTAYELLQQAQLASAESVEKLRGTLIDDSPCPVCGSTSHPYKIHNPQLENVLAQLEKSYRSAEQIYFACYSQHTALQQETNTLQQSITQQNEAIASKRVVLETKKKDWEQFDISKASQAVADVEKAAWIDEKLQNLKAKQVDLLTQLKDYADKKHQLETIKNEIESVKENTENLGKQLSTIQNQLSLYHEQQSHKAKEQDKAISDLNRVEQLLSPYFSTSDWMEKWKSAPVEFTGSIEMFARNWRENTERLEIFIRQKTALEATLNELEKQSESLTVELATKNDVFVAQHNSYLDLILQRNVLFAGQPAATIESQLKQAQSEAQQQLEQLKESQQQLNIHSAKIHTQKEELAAALTALETEAQKALQKIQDWLNDYNQKNNQSLNMDALHKLLELSTDWMTAERAALKTIDDEVTKARSILDERKHAFERHKQNAVSESPLEELLAHNANAKLEAEQKKHKKGENSFRLIQDEANKNSIRDLLKSINAQAVVTENWSKLNDVVGSSDGKKFRQIAQEYTLDVLLGYSNIHLQMLTTRYRIERIPSTLGLQVVDQDMGDEVRTVYSLSGGESFLVSLALALGLASLSSSRMKVESLFIDEGFGSLDPATLNIAMDALERLHNQGRKVGVISHVQEMTERIPVQIKVSKMQSGKSKVEVAGI